MDKPDVEAPPPDTEAPKENNEREHQTDNNEQPALIPVRFCDDLSVGSNESDLHRRRRCLVLPRAVDCRRESELFRLIDLETSKQTRHSGDKLKVQLFKPFSVECAETKLTRREVVDGFGHRRLTFVNQHRNVFRNDENIIVRQLVGIHAAIGI